MNKLAKLLLVIFLLILSFLLGIGFDNSIKQKEISLLENKRYKVNISINGDNIKIEKPENIDVNMKK